MGELPVGTVTFLFTDLEGSTRLWQDHPEGMPEALARHDAILRAAIEAHGGVVVKTTGDGAHAAFPTASDAIDAAVAGQIALASEAWVVPDPLRVRMGIHSGPAEVRDGDYYGTAVNRAARIMSVAHGGQIVVSLAAQELVRDTPIEVHDLGEHRLRDLGEPEHLFQVRHPELEGAFPPVRSLDAFTTNLPVQATSFVGRDVELAAVVEALGEARLVTLTGVGGVGKTRLAVQAAAELLSEFPDGVWWVDLAAVGDPDAVPAAVASTLGLVPQPGLTTTAGIAEVLAGRTSLLVLDNCEHVLDAAASLVEAILARPGSTKVLSTSREGLRVASERLWPVPSLGGRGGGLDEAVTLFVDRARAVAPDLEPDAPGHAEAIDEICRRLDGIPLAIELAAARAIAMSPSEVRDRLDDRFRLLSGSRRGLERHQTLRHAVQWSYDLLDDDERLLLNRCSVFAGGFDLDAAVAIAGDDALDEYAVLDLLDALVRKSLVTVDRSSGRTRYGMLETIRQFAEERLGESAETGDVWARYARYFARWAREAVEWFATGVRQREARDRFDREFANLRAAFRAAVNGDDVDAAATIAAVTAPVGYMLERYEPAAWAESILEVARNAEHPLCATLYAGASMCTAAGRTEEGYRYAEAARALLGDPRSEWLPYGLTVLPIAPAYLHVGRPDRWCELCETAIDRSGDPEVIVRAFVVMALAWAGRLDEAAAQAPDVIDAAEAADDRLALAPALLAYSMAFFDRDPSASLAAMRRSRAVSRELGLTEAGHAAMLGRNEAAHGDRGAALDSLEESVRGYAACGDRVGANTSLAVLASLLHEIGHDEAAAVVAGCAASTPMASFGYPEATARIEQVRVALGDDMFDALCARGAAMDSTTVFRYALEQIEHARAAL